MQDVLIQNKKLIKSLNDYAEVIFAMSEEDREKLHYPRYDDKFNAEYCCSHEYLQEHLKNPPLDTGWPLHAKGFDINTSMNADIPPGWQEAADKLDRGIMEAIGVGFSALKMYYPADGYIGWHNNCNCPGQNLLLSYSRGGDGYFEWLNPITKEVVRMQDRPGWTAKVGYYGSDREPDKTLWHCAKTNEPRITVSYVVRDQSMWEYMVEDIQSSQ